MSGTSLLTTIEDKMYALIAGMQAEPYNNVWGTVNERDMAKAKYPMAVIYFDGEANVDDANGTWSEAYYNEVTFRIEVKAQLDAQYDNPVVQIRQNLYLALDDLKMLFGNNWNLESACDTIMYRGAEIIEERAGDILVPSRMVTRWLVRYEQDRQIPTQVAQ